MAKDIAEPEYDLVADDETVRLLHDDWAQHSELPVRDRMLHALNRLDQVPVRIALAGQSGAGKSTLINTLRNLPPRAPGAAATGVEQSQDQSSLFPEATTVIEEYPFPNNASVVLVDLPGVNTPQFPQDNYVQAAKLADYDMVLIVYHSRVQETDMWLAEQLARLKKPFWFVRSKLDADIRQHLHDADQPSPAKLEDVSEEHVQEVLTQLKKKLESDIGQRFADYVERRGVPPCFFVSGYEENNQLYDLPRSMIEALPTLRRNSLILLLETLNRELRQAEEASLARPVASSRYPRWMPSIFSSVFSRLEAQLDSIFLRSR